MKDRNCSSLMRCASSLQRLFFLALLSIIAIGAYAQGKTVSGTVLDKSGESVIGASVVVKFADSIYALGWCLTASSWS